jgi:uncharacterized protein (DUF2236 family)
MMFDSSIGCVNDSSQQGDLCYDGNDCTTDSCLDAACVRVRADRHSARGVGRGAQIHAVELESFVLVYRTYAGRLSEEDADRYVVEMARVAEMVELPAQMAPQSMGEVHEYLNSVRPTLQATPGAFDGLRVVLFPPMQLQYRPLWIIPTTAAVAILPRYARRMYRLPWIPGARLPVRAAMFPLSRALNWMTPTPPIVRAAHERVAA